MASHSASSPLDSPNANASDGAAAAARVAAHSRAYQACEGCRSRKVRCVMGTGDVDRPAGPPCNRCLREQKRCVFSDTRRKRREELEERDFLNDETEEWDQSYNEDESYVSPPVEAGTARSNKRTRKSMPPSSMGSVDGQPGQPGQPQFEAPFGFVNGSPVPPLPSNRAASRNAFPLYAPNHTNNAISTPYGGGFVPPSRPYVTRLPTYYPICTTKHRN
jgi:hypothetical protein